MARVLIVDDDPSFLRSLSRSVEAHGHEVETAENGRVGFQAVTGFGADLVILDMNMPEMDGMAFLRLLRSVRSSLPVIAISGGAMMLEGDATLAAAEAFPAVTSIQKPFSIETLLAAIEAALA